jgi:hypothetical protein
MNGHCLCIGLEPQGVAIELSKLLLQASAVGLGFGMDLEQVMQAGRSGLRATLLLDLRMRTGKDVVELRSAARLDRHPDCASKTATSDTSYAANPWMVAKARHRLICMRSFDPAVPPGRPHYGRGLSRPGHICALESIASVPFRPTSWICTVPVTGIPRKYSGISPA